MRASRSFASWMAKRCSTGSGTWPEAILGRGAELAQLVLRLGEREPAVEVDLLRPRRRCSRPARRRRPGRRREPVARPRAACRSARRRPRRAARRRARSRRRRRARTARRRGGRPRRESRGRASRSRSRRRARCGRRAWRGGHAPPAVSSLPVRIEEVGVRGDVAPAHAPADLVELRESERVGALDDQRVRLRDVEARLDDRRRDEHVGVAGEEREHVLLELPLRASGRARRGSEAPDRAAGGARPPPRSSRRGCAGRRTGRRARASRVSASGRAPRRTRRRGCGSGAAPGAASRSR